MINRKQKVKELMEGFQSMRRHMSFGPAGFVKMPRITPSQWGALMLIEHGQESTVKDVAAALHITSSAATQLVDGLVASGYVVRKGDPKDRRRVTLLLSKVTKNHVTKMKNQVAKGFLRAFKVLSDNEFNQYLALSKKLALGVPEKC